MLLHGPLIAGGPRIHRVNVIAGVADLPTNSDLNRALGYLGVAALCAPEADLEQVILDS